MKNLNNKYLQISLFAIATIVISGFLLMSFQRLPDLREVFATITAVLAPVFWGIAIAYILSKPVNFFENRVFGKLKNRGRARGFALTVIITITLFLLTGLFIVALPQLASSVLGIFKNMPRYFEVVRDWTEQQFPDNEQITAFFADPINNMSEAFNKWMSTTTGANGVNGISNFLSNIGSGLWSVLSAFKDILIGFIIAVYFLSAKEMISTQLKKLLFAFFDNDKCLKLLGWLCNTDTIFHRYLSGLILDATIVGMLTFVAASIIGTPAPLLLAVIIALTNFIPFFGPFIGGIPTAFIVLMDNPLKALIFVVFLLVMQQFDGNVIAPAIQGDVTGVPSVWILVAIIVGGGLFGFAGMLLSVPVFAVIYSMSKGAIELKLRAKCLPVRRIAYERSEDVARYTRDFDFARDMPEQVYADTLYNETEGKGANGESQIQKLKGRAKALLRRVCGCVKPLVKGKKK